MTTASSHPGDLAEWTYKIGQCGCPSSWNPSAPSHLSRGNSYTTDALKQRIYKLVSNPNGLFSMTLSLYPQRLHHSISHHNVVNSRLLSRSGIFPKTSSSASLSERNPLRNSSPRGSNFFSSIVFVSASIDSPREAGIRASTPIAAAISGVLKDNCVRTNAS